MEQKTKFKNYGLAAFIPLFVFLVFFIGSGVYFSIVGGVEKPWGQFPRESAIFLGLIAAFLMAPKTKINDKFKVFAESASNAGVFTMVSIFLLAGAFQGVCKATGASTSVVNLGLSIIPPQFILPGLFIVSAVIATAMGTSTGTLVVIAPIALAVAQELGANVEMFFAAVWGGSVFGDNLSIISDTTIAACQGAGCEMKDKFRMNFSIALPAALAAVIVYAFVGGGNAAAISADLSYNIILVLPYFYVLAAAIAGMNVYLVLSSGIILSGLIGIITGNMTFIGFVGAIGSGMSGMMGMSVLAMLIAGLIGMSTAYGGIEWLLEKLESRVKTRKGAEYAIGLICTLLDFATITNTITIIVSAPVAKRIADKYGIAPKRTASLLDIFACIFMGFIPHANYLLVLTGFYPELNPMGVITNQFYCLFLLIAVVITIQFGLGRTKEEKEFEKAMIAKD